MAALFRKLRLFSTVVRTNKTMRGVFFAVAKDWEIIQQCGVGKKKNRIMIFLAGSLLFHFKKMI